MKTFQKSPCGGLEGCGPVKKTHGEQKNKVVKFIAEAKIRIKRVSGKIISIAGRICLCAKTYVEVARKKMTSISNLLTQGVQSCSIKTLKAESS